jgi:uncharacterized membrane protein
MFWLSHHRDDELNRTYSIAGLRVCARCLATYPLALAAIAVQIARHAPLFHPLDPLVALVLPIPALIDWSVGRFNPRAGSNAVRSATGALLGLSLARTLYVHFQRPFHTYLLLQLALCLLVAAPVLVLSLRKRPRE